MPINMERVREYNAAKAKERDGIQAEKPPEDGGGFFAGIAERQAAQGSDLSGEIAAEEKDYTDEEVAKQASALRYLAEKTAENVGEKAIDTLTGNYHALLEDEYQEAGLSEKAAAVAEEEASRQEGQIAKTSLFDAATKEAGREFIAAYADRNGHPLQSLAEGLRRTDTNIAYWMTDEERLSKAKEIEEATGIPASALLSDHEAYRSAMNIYDHQRKVEAIVGTQGGIEASHQQVMAKVYEEFPGLDKLSKEDPAAAALALHDIHHVREAHDTITAWKEAWHYGWLEQEYGILKDKEADGKASENDRARMAALEKELEKAPVTPSFFEAPHLTAISGLAGSMPMMTDALTEGALWGVAGAAMGAAVSAPAGGAGAVPGFFSGGTRGMARAIGRHAVGRGIASGFTWGRRIGELNSMYKVQRGQDFAEYQKMTDEFGERLLSDEEAARYSQVSGAAKAAVEVAPMELFLSKFKASPQAQKVFRRIIEQGEMDRAFRRDVFRAATGRGKDILEVTMAEAGEEGAQQAIGDIAHNQIELDTGDTNAKNGGVFTPEEIMTRAGVATVAALPTSFLFGVIPAAVGSGLDAGRFSKLGKEMEKLREAYSAEERQTMAGTVVLAELQRVAEDSRLKETSPKTQRALLREELSGTGLEVAYIDTALAKEQENGIEDIKKAGRAAGLSEEAIADTVDAGGILAVPVECYAQSAASPALLETVSFSAEAEPMGRMKARAKAFYEEAKERLKGTAERQKRLEEMITKELFPSEGEERDMAMEAMALNPENPAQGWREMEAELERAREAEVNAAKMGMENGSTQEGGAEGKARIEEIDHKRKVLSSIKERMMTLTGKEMRETETLTGEGFRVYRSILSDLKSAENPKVTRAARIGALLFARHADIYAAAMRRRGGDFAVYTAMDYYDKAFALDVSGRAKGDGATYGQPITNLKINLNAIVDPVVIRPQFEGKDWREIRANFPASIREAVVTGDDEKGHAPYINEQTGRALVVTSHSIRHIKATQNSGTKEQFTTNERETRAHFELIAAIPEIAQKGIWIEEHPDFHALEKGRSGGKENSPLESVSVIVCPVKIGSGNNIYIAKLTVKKYKPQKIHGELKQTYALIDGTYTPYRVYDSALIAKEPHISGTYMRPSLKQDTPTSLTDTGSFVSPTIQDILTAVNDKLGAPYVDEQGKPNFGVYTENGVMFLVPGDTALKGVLKNPALYQEAANAQTAAERLKEDEKAWGDTVDSFMKGEIKSGVNSRIMGTPLVFQLIQDDLGIPIEAGIPLKIHYGILHKILRDTKKHALDIAPDMMKALPTKLADPIMVLKNRQGETKEVIPGEVVCVVDMKDAKGNTVIVPITFAYKNGAYQVKTVFGKQSSDWFMARLLMGDVLYANKEKTSAWIKPAGHQSPMGLSLGDSFYSSIKTEADLVKEKMKNPALYQETHGATAMLQNGRRIVSLFESADESTFLHELGHVFLDDLRQLAAFDEVSQRELSTVDAWAAWREGAAKEYQDTPWAAEFRGYEAAILRAKAAGDNAALEKALALWRHERFARAFELYLKEGEAPARGLKQVFRKFAGFLRDLYRVFTANGGRASEDVERVMDRMIATDEEIEAAAQGKRYQDITKVGGETLFSETEKETYQRWYEKGKAEAKERLSRIVERKMKGERRKKMEDEIESEEERFRETLYNEPIHRAREAVKLSGDEKAALLFYEDLAAYRAEDEADPTMEELVKEHMEAYRREREKALLAAAITPEEVARAMASPKYHALRLSLEAAAFRRHVEALHRLGGRTRAIMDEVEEKIEGLTRAPGAEEKGETLTKEEVTARIKEAVQGMDEKDIPKIAIEDAHRFDSLGRKVLFDAAIKELEKLTAEKIIDPLGNEVYFAPGATENLESYILHLTAGKGQPIEKIRGNRILGLSLAKETIAHPLAIIVQENGRRSYLALYTDGNNFHNNIIVGVEEGQEGRVVTSMLTADKKGDKKAAVREFKKRISGSKEVLYCEGLSGHSRPSAETWASALNAKLHPSGKFIIADEGGKNKPIVTNLEKYANKKDSPTAEVFARSADNPDGAHSTIGGNLSLAPTIAQKKLDGQAVSKVVDENGEPLLYGDKKAAASIAEGNGENKGAKESGKGKAEEGASKAKKAKEETAKTKKTEEGAAKAKRAKEEEASAKDPQGWRDLMRAIHRLRAAHRWGAEELSAIDALTKAANRIDLKEAWAKVKELLTKAHVNEQELKEAARGKSQLYRELARKELSAMPLSEAMAVLTYRRQEIEAARRVEKLIKAEKWEEAEVEKERQIMAAAMAREAGKIREKVGVIRRRVERYLKGKEKLPPSEGYWLHHLAYLLRLTEKDAAKPAELETLEDITARLSAGLDIQAKGEWSPLSAAMALSASPAENGYLGMTMEDFEGVVRGIDILYVTGRDGGKMKTMAGRTLEEIRDEIISDPTNLLDGVAVTENKINPNEGGLGYSALLRKVPLLGQQMANAGQRYLAATMKPELMMELLGEKASRYLYGTMERAAEHEAQMTAAAMAAVDHLVSAYTKEERRAWQERSIVWWGGEKISKENILAMALNLGNEINRSRLAEGLSDKENPHIIEEIVARIEQHMTERDWQFVQGVWDFLGTYWPETVRIEMMMNGTVLHPQPALSFTARTKEGREVKLRGGYYPIVYNAEKSEQAREYSLDEEAKRSMQGAAALSTGLGSTKERTKGTVKQRPLLLSLRVIPKHLGEVIHNQTHRVACRDVYHIIHDEAFAAYVKKRMGTPFYENLKAWAVDLWQTRSAELNQAEGDISKLMQGLRSNAALAIMGWRMWPVVENATNIFPAMNEIGAAEMISAVGDFYANLGTYRELLHKSLFMESRMTRMDRDLKRQRGMFEEEGEVPGWLKDHAYWCMEKTDLMFSAPLWCRAYKNAFAPKLAEVMAENEAAKKEIEKAASEDAAAEAKVYDLMQRQRAVEEELTRRRHGARLTEETELSRTPKADLEAEAFHLHAAIGEAEREAAEKHRRFDLVSEREIKTPKEMNTEAEKRAIFAADRAVRNVFGSGDVKDLASVQKGGELMKLFTMFYGYFSVQANGILRAYYRGRSAKSWAPLASAILYRIILTSALATLGKMLLFGEGDDDKDKYRKDEAGNKIEIPWAERILKQYAKNTLSTATGMAVGVRDIGSFYINMAFEGTDYGRGLALFGTASSRGVNEAATLSKLLMAREEVNEKADLAEARRKARYEKMTPRQKRKFDEEQKYRRPPRRIGWLDIARSAAMTGTYLTANKLGVTDTMTNAVFSTMQYIWDDDGRYEASLKNMLIRSAIFGKKPIKRVIPEKPKKEEKRRRRRRK